MTWSPSFLSSLALAQGPGSIAEAAACALPIMLFDFLPGQEEANVDFVRDRGMGGYEEVCGPSALPTVACEGKL